MPTVKVKVGDRVVFRDRWDVARTGTVRNFERVEGSSRPLAHITDVEGETTGYVVSMTKVAVPGTPLAEQWLHPASHVPPGTLVRADYPAKFRHKTYGGLAHGDLGVVLQDKGDIVNIVKFGGTGRDEYARLPHRSFTVVPDELVHELLAFADK